MTVVVACIPAYNEERMIASVVLRSLNQVDVVVVVVCDDGSKDLTGEIAQRLGAKVVSHNKNLGKGAALRTAFRYAKDLRPDVVVMLDGDGQHDPDEIPRLIDPIRDGMADMVVGSRYTPGNKMDAPLYRRLGLSLINRLSSYSGDSGVSDTQSGFRAFSVKALDVMLGCTVEGYGVETEQLALAHRNSLRVLEVPVAIKYSGLEHSSKMNPAYHGIELVDTVLKLVVEDRPLLFLALPGSILVLFGVGLGAYTLWNMGVTQFFNVPFGFITIGSFFLGMLLIVSSMILYTIKRNRQ